MEANNPLKRLSRRQEGKLLAAATAMARHDFENPDRKGCPSRDTLRRLAQRDPSIEGEPQLVDHVGTCSPCFVDYSGFRGSYTLRQRLRIGCVAAIVLVACLAAWSFRGKFGLGQPSSPEIPLAARGKVVAAVLDLRAKSTPRGPENDAETNEYPRLKRARFFLTIQLPVGSEDGSYDVALADASGRIVRQTSGTARLDTFIEVLPVSLDLSDLRPGRYTLRYRRERAPWSEQPVVLD